MNTAPRPTKLLPAPSPTPTGVTKAIVVVAHNEAELAEHIPAWRELGEHALDPNAFHEPWLLLPALRAFGSGESPRFVFVYGPTIPPSRRRVLLGFFPLTAPRRLSRLLPVRVVETWKHVYSFLSTPLLHAGRGGEGLRAFFDWLRHDRDGAALWRTELASAEGPFARLLTEVLNERQHASFVVESYSRAVIEPAADADSYLRAALPHKRLKEYRRRERHLAEKGHLEKRVLDQDGDVDAWIDAFLELEAGGWKGQAKTAMKCNPADADFFRAMVRGAHERHRLLMVGLFLDGRPIALKCNLLSPPGSFAFKIAFDEADSHFSPGVLLELANVEHLHAARPVRWMDSCAVPDHFMINRLWTERRAVQTILVATGRAPGDFVVSLMPLARWLKRKLNFRRKGVPDTANQEQQPPEAARHDNGATP